MARIKLGPVITDISGSIGGITFQRNKFGMTLREKPLPLNPFTSAQYVVRQHMQSIQISWQNLTDAQRLQWDRFLDFSGQTINSNKSVKLSGHTLFIKYQMIRLMSGRPLLATFSYIPMPTVSPFDKFTVSGSFLYVNFSPTIDSSEYFFLVRVSTPRIPNRVFSFRGLRVMEAFYQDGIQFAIYTPYIAAFGFVPSIGDTLHYSLQYYSYRDPIFSGIQTGVAVIEST